MSHQYLFRSSIENFVLSNTRSNYQLHKLLILNKFRVISVALEYQIRGNWTKFNLVAHEKL